MQIPLTGMLQLFGIGLLGLGVLLVVGSSSAALILRSKFPAVWAAEGNPSHWIWLTRTRPKRHFFRFLDERRYRATGSAWYARFCAALRAGWYVFLLLFATAFIGAIVVVVAAR